MITLDASSNALIDFGLPLFLTGKTAVTWAGYWRPTDVSETNGILSSWGDGAHPTKITFTIRNLATGRLVLAIGNATGPVANLEVWYSDDVVFTANTRYHIAITWSQPSTVVMYVNGVVVASTSITTTGATTAFGTPGANLQFGRETDEPFAGSDCDETHWAIWGAVQDGTTIAALAAGASPINYPTNLLFYAPLIRIEHMRDVVTGIVGTPTACTTSSNAAPAITYPANWWTHTPEGLRAMMPPTRMNTTALLSAHDGLNAGEFSWERSLADPTKVIGFYIDYDGVAKTSRIRRAHASVDDLDNWTEDGVVLSHGTSGDWDESVARSPCIHFNPEDGNKLYCTYSGYKPDESDGRTGLATSTDEGLTFTKNVGNPIMALGVDETYNTQLFSIRIDSTHWKGGYAWRGDGVVLDSIRAAVSSDNITWTETGATLFEKSVGAGFYAGYIEGGQLVALPGGKFLLALSTSDAQASTARWVITFAFCDTVHGTYVAEPVPTLDRSNIPGSFDKEHTATPWMRFLFRTWHMPYQGAADRGAGNDYSVATWAIGRAVFEIDVVPTAPANLVATGGDGVVDLAWDTADYEASAKVYRSDSEMGSYSLIASGVLDSVYSDDTAVSGTEYWYKVKATDAAGDSGFSNAASATTTGEAPDTTPPVRVALRATKGFIYVKYDELLDTGSVPAHTDYASSVKTLTTPVTVSGKTVKIPVTVPFAAGDSGGTLSYTGGTNKVKDLAGNLAPNFSTQAVTNTTRAVGTGGGDDGGGLLAHLPQL